MEDILLVLISLLHQTKEENEVFSMFLSQIRAVLSNEMRSEEEVCLKRVSVRSFGLCLLDCVRFGFIGFIAKLVRWIFYFQFCHSEKLVETVPNL